MFMKFNEMNNQTDFTFVVVIENVYLYTIHYLSVYASKHFRLN